MNLHIKVIRKLLKETYSGALFLILVALVSLLWYYFSWVSYEWRSIEPIEQPDTFVRIVYSFLVFFTLWLLLYFFRFYQLLHFVFVRLLGDRRAYKKIKWFIWLVLMWLMYLVIVPFVVDTMNNVLSFLYNLLGILVYLMPALWISITTFLIGIVLYAKIVQKNTEISSRGDI